MSCWQRLLAAVVALWGASASAGVIPIDTAHFDEQDNDQATPSEAPPSPDTGAARPNSPTRELRPAATARAVPSARDASQFGHDPTEDGNSHIFRVLDAPPPVRKVPALELRGAIEIPPTAQPDSHAPPDPTGQQDSAAAERQPTPADELDTASASPHDSAIRELSSGDPAWGFFVLVLTSFGLLVVVATGGAIYRKGRDDRYDEHVQANFQSRMNSAYDRRQSQRVHPGEASASLRYLGLDDSATETEVLAAYRQLALRAHPDHNGDPHAFKRLHVHFERALKHAQSHRRREDA
jgi:hypothetical protein